MLFIIADGKSMVTFHIFDEWIPQRRASAARFLVGHEVLLVGGVPQWRKGPARTKLGGHKGTILQLRAVGLSFTMN